MNIINAQVEVLKDALKEKKLRETPSHSGYGIKEF